MEAVEEEALRLWNWCKAKVLEFKDKPEAIPFLEPVDWVKLKLPLYPNIIKKPIDLRTIKRKLERHEYSDILEFNKDMKLIWSNAKKFNMPRSDIFKKADSLSRLWEKTFASIANDSVLSKMRKQKAFRSRKISQRI